MFKHSGFCHFIQGDAANRKVETPAEYRTSFSCVGRLAGYYADIDSGCQVSFCSVPVMVPEISTPLTLMGRLYDLVVKVPGYLSRGPGFGSQLYQIF
jgi:hypothetical protein